MAALVSLRGGGGIVMMARAREKEKSGRGGFSHQDALGSLDVALVGGEHLVVFLVKVDELVTVNLVGEALLEGSLENFHSSGLGQLRGADQEAKEDPLGELVGLGEVTKALALLGRLGNGNRAMDGVQRTLVEQGISGVEGAVKVLLDDAQDLANPAHESRFWGQNKTTMGSKKPKTNLALRPKRSSCILSIGVSNSVRYLATLWGDSKEKKKKKG